jgi:hypothetical protein
MKNTANKWKAIAQMPNGYAIEDCKGRVIAMTQCDEDDNDDNPITWQEEVKHANLIASAPELLEALEVAFNLADKLQMPTESELNELKQLAQQAINKAKGL